MPAELRSWTDKSHSCESEPSAKASAPTGRERYSGRSSLHMKLMPTSEPTIPDSCLAESSHVETSCWPGRYMYESTVSNDVGGSMYTTVAHAKRAALPNPKRVIGAGPASVASELALALRAAIASALAPAIASAL